MLLSPPRAPHPQALSPQAGRGEHVSACGGAWNQQIAALAFAALVFAAVFGAYGISAAAAESRKIAEPAAETVSLTIDFGDGSKKSFTFPWKEEMTIGSALEGAAAHPRGIRYETRGKGATAFLTAIDDLKNEGGKGKNWFFRLNGKLGQRSFAITPLEPGDAVLWEFGTYR